MSHHHNPNLFKDVSTAEAGMIASDIAEDSELISERAIRSHSYGTVQDNDNIDQTTETNDDITYALPKRQLYTVISSLFMASFLAALDTTVVTTLLSMIASELNAVAYISWIATAYLVSCSAFQPLFGKLSDIFGRKVLLLICCGLFAVGCMICATNSLIWLVIGRFVTGCGGSGLTTLGTITMSDLIPLRERGLYQGLANIFFGLGAASGGILGGLVADWLGWRYVFILQVPLAIIVGIAIWYNLNLPAGSPGLGAHGEDIRQKLKRVDFLGSFFLVSAIMIILIAASSGGKEFEYTSYSFLGLVISAFVLLACFTYTELYISEEPIIPIELLSERTVLSSSLTNWFYTMGVFAYLYYIPIYFSAVLNFTATQSGTRLISNFFGISFGSVGAGLYMKKTGGYYKLVVGVGLLATVGVIRIYSINPEISLFNQFTILLPCGFSYSSILTITLLSLIASVPSKYQACTTSIQYTFRSTGSTLGVSIGSAIFQNILKKTLRSEISRIVSDPKKASKIIERALDSTSYSNEAPKYVRDAIRGAYASACKGALGFSVVTIIIGFLCSLFMREHVLHNSINRK